MAIIASEEVEQILIVSQCTPSHIKLIIYDNVHLIVAFVGLLGGYVPREKIELRHNLVHFKEIMRVIILYL